MDFSIKKKFIFVGIATCALFALLTKSGCSGDKPSPFVTATVKRGDLIATISATGTVEPEDVIDVGAQVAGRIISFGKDKNGKEIDYGSEVEEGTVLAQIDDALYAADVAQARAALVRAEADFMQMQAKLFQAERDWQRAQKLGPSDALSQSDFDAAKAAYEVAKANVAVGSAAIGQATAALQRAEKNLSYCTIRSPVKGVIIDRRVNIGQTVVASLNAPSLFLLARDLKHIQVWVSVNEADIGSIYVGQPVSFTVDTYPGQVFRGEVGKIRLNATMTQNVVTYTVEVITDNANGKLLPYLTANVQFELSKSTNVLLVPNAALRWFPQAGQVDKKYKDIVEGSDHRAGVAQTEQKAPMQPVQKGRQGLLWVPDGNLVKPIKVSIGHTDGTFTDVQSDELHEGLEIIIGEQMLTSAGDGARSPFAPPPIAGGRR
ncbi:MAG: efflux RND transporter periplasmic adaptor subunit [Desulfobacterota bacterium]|nr:efflux RND transporter periplasmic adaptor subunit [Thermodesulfobacteriota bacterium]